MMAKRLGFWRKTMVSCLSQKGFEEFCLNGNSDTTGTSHVTAEDKGNANGLNLAGLTK